MEFIFSVNPEAEMTWKFEMDTEVAKHEDKA